MALVLIGLVLIGLKWAAIGPTAAWPWWHVLVPFVLAVLWWKWSDSTGRTARKGEERLQQKRDAARQRRKDSMHGRL